MSQPWVMTTLIVLAIVLGVLLLLYAILALRIVKQYQRGVLFRLGRVIGVRVLPLV
jgi:regulator of protease activity HflC (stomatin/prohibitin superfamily)